MTDDELVTLLRETMRAHDAAAPTADAIRERLDAPRPMLAPSRRRWLPVAAAAVVVAIVVAAGVTWSVSRDDSGSSPGPSEPNPPTEPATRTVTVFFAKRVDLGFAFPVWRLIPQRVTTRDTGDPGLDAVRALFDRPAPRDLMNWFNLRGDPVAKVNSVDVVSDQIVVDVDRSLLDPDLGIDCICPDAETVLQQLAWTVSTALRSQLPILLTVNGHPARAVNGENLTGDGMTSRYPIAEGHRDFPWYRDACGPLQVVAVTSDDRHVDVPVRSLYRPTATVDLSVGQTLRIEISGGCFRALSVGSDPSRVLESISLGDRTFVARHPGQASVGIGESACGTYFIDVPCEGLGPGVVAVDVRVTAD